MNSVAIIILNYNTPELTESLVRYLRETMDYSDKDVYVLDNGSAQPAPSTTHLLGQNLGFTRGMTRGYEIASAAKKYDAYWFLNVDVIFEHGNNVLKEMVEVLFSRADYAEISPQHNSPHPQMLNANSEAQEVAFLEATATLVKASTIEKIGFWDQQCTLGWGIDYDYGWRVRQAGMKNIVTNRARLTHLQKSSYDRGAYAARANAEMGRVLTQKYGPNFMRITRMETNPLPAPQASPRVPAPPAPPPTSLAVCAIFRNEAPYLREWLEFHLLQGVEKFYLYQNRSTDDWQSALKPYIERGQVDLREWPNTGPAQLPAYSDCFQRLKGQRLWLAVIDIDEFLYSPKFATVPEALATLPPAWGAIGVHWICFGASGREDYSPEPVMERFTWRPVDSFHVNTHIKSVVRMDRAVSVRGDAHYFQVQGGTFNERGGVLSGARPQGYESSLLRINHYTTKSRQEYYRRIALGRVDGAGFVPKSVFEERQDRDYDDRTIWKWLPELKNRLAVA